MGCDIHLHTEVKVDGVWHAYSVGNVNRDYDLFALLANVRNRGDVTPIAEPRGLPEDASVMTRFHAKNWKDDGHSHSYITAEEMVRVEDFIEERGGHGVHGVEGMAGYLFGNTWAGFTRYPEDRPEGVEDVRWVFWFDN